MHCLNLLLAGAIAAASAAPIHGQTKNWQIDSAHSTASFTLTSSSKTGRTYNLAIALVAGRLDVDPSAPADAAMSFNIFPAGQGSYLLTQDGKFRSGALGTLTKYTVLHFHSERASFAPDGKLVLTGRLTAEHVQRRASVVWSTAYTGPEYSDPDVDHFAGEAVFTLDLPTAVQKNGQSLNAGEVSASVVIKRADFPGLWSALRASKWPVVVFDEKCEMPYYPGPSLRDYKGPDCTGTPVLVSAQDGQPLTPPAIEAIGSVVPTPPEGDQIAIEVHLQLTRENLDGSGTDVDPMN